MNEFKIVSEIETKNGYIQVRKYSDDSYDVGNLINDVFEPKHPNCGADGAIRALSNYLQNFLTDKVI